MTTKINSDTSDGLKITSDTSGVLDIQSAGTTKMTVGTTIDIQGNELVLDADADTSIHASTDDQIDFKVGGSDVCVMTSAGTILAPQIFHARDEKSQGTSAGNSIAGDNTRVINTVLTNTITGASLSSNQITLPAGTYDVIASAPAHNPARHKLFFYNNTDSVSDIRGLNADSESSGSVTTRATLKQRITISAQKVYILVHYTQSAQSTYGLGLANNNGVEIYTDVHITKVA